MKHIVIGTKFDGKGEVLFAGDCGDRAAKAMESKGYRVIERHRLHAPMKRIVFDAPKPAAPKKPESAPKPAA